MNYFFVFLAALKNALMGCRPFLLTLRSRLAPAEISLVAGGNCALPEPRSLAVTAFQSVVVLVIGSAHTVVILVVIVVVFVVEVGLLLSVAAGRGFGGGSW